MAIFLKQACSTFIRLFAYTIALRDIGVFSADITQNNYKVVKDQFNKPVASHLDTQSTRHGQLDTCRVDRVSS